MVLTKVLMFTVSYSVVGKVESAFRRRIYAAHYVVFREPLGKCLRDMWFLKNKNKNHRLHRNLGYGDLLN